MRTKTLLTAAAVMAAGALTSMAQVYSVNIVGYINLTVPSGYSMIANQLNATPDNTLATILPAPPEGTSIFKFDPNKDNGAGNPKGGYITYTYSVDNPGWLPTDGALAPGEGAFVAIDPNAIAPATTATFTFVGEVQLVSSTPVNNGYQILSSVIPQSDTVDNLGFPSREGDNIYLYDQTKDNGAGNPKGGYVTYNFSADNPGWLGPAGYPAQPTPKVGESFFCAADQTQGGNRTWQRTFSVGP